MKKRSDRDWISEREKIIGLGESSVRKTYFPQLQQKLDELERFRALLDHTRDSIFLVLASSLAVVDVNSTACREMHCSRNQLLSASMHEFLPEDAIGMLDEAVRSGKTGERERVITTVLRNCSGDETPVEITFQLVNFNGMCYGVAVARDIRERRRAEAELKQSEERLRFASSAAGIGTWNWDLTTNELIWSARCKELFGFPPEADVTYDAFLGKIAEYGRGMVDAAVWTALRERSDYLVEMQVILPDGSRRWLLSQGRGFYDEAGNALGMHGIVLDITDRKNYEKQLEEARGAAEAASHAKSQFLANMSHELRTPINGIMGVLQLFLGGYEGRLDGEWKELFRKADRSARSLLRIIEDILDLSRIEAGKLSLKHEGFSLHEAVADAVQLFAVEARNKGLDLKLSMGDDVPDRCNGDPVRVRQVLMNLIGNALKFTDKGETDVAVSVVARGSDGLTGVKFTVTDTGIGIPEAQVSRLFEPFTQVDPSDTRRFGGTGLGLAICRRLVELMGGTIGFSSEEGLGSTFFFIIPLREEGPAATQTIHAPAVQAVPVQRTGRNPRILVAEDDPLASELLQNILEHHGLETDLARTGREAVDMWEHGKYDLIIMDVQMPQMDGITATQLIRKKERATGAHVPIMAMTAHAFPEDEARCLAAGMDAYQTKPLDFDRGMRMILSLLPSVE